MNDLLPRTDYLPRKLQVIRKLVIHATQQSTIIQLGWSPSAQNRRRLKQRGIEHKRVLYNNQHAGGDGEKWVDGAGGKLSRDRNLWIQYAMILPYNGF